jgi:DNA-binding transcriptional LysR family regulator
MLERGEIHLAQMPAGDERFASRLLYPTVALALMPKSHRLARRAAIEVAELAEQPLLLLTRQSQARQWIDAAFGMVHVRPRVFMESAVPHTLTALAAAGHGIAVVPSNVAIPVSEVRAIPLALRGTAIGRWSAIAWDAQRYLPPYARDFIDELVAYAARRNPGRAFVKHAPPLPRPSETTAARPSG